jgi:outer membrane protein
MKRLFTYATTLLAAIVFVAVLSLAQPAGTDSLAQPMSLEQAVKLAMENNPELRTARLEVDRSDARVMEAIGSALPAIDLTGRYAHALEKPVFFLPDFSNLASGRTMAVKIGSDFSMDATIAAKQILFNGAVFVGVGAANIYSQLARVMHFAKQVETVTKVKKAYYGALLANEVVAMMRSSLRNAEDNLKNVQLMRQQGILSEYDELRATVGVDNLRPAVIQSETNAILALENLRNAAGIGSAGNISLSDSLRFVLVDDSLLQRAESIMLEANPNLNAVKRQVDLNSAIIFAERSSYLPIVSAFGQYQYQAAKNNFNFSTNDFIRSAQVGINISMNIFQGLQTNSRVEQAQLEKRKSEEQHTSVERSLRTGLNAIRGNIAQTRKRVEAQGKTVETATRGYAIVTTRFLANAATQLEVNDAQLALNQARVNRVQAIYDYLVATAELDQMIGRLPSYVNGIVD